MSHTEVRTGYECEMYLKDNFILHTPYYYANHKITATCRKCGHTATKNAGTFMYLGCSKCNERDRKIEGYLDNLGWRMAKNKSRPSEDRTLLVCKHCGLKRIVSYEEDLVERRIGRCRCQELNIKPAITYNPYKELTENLIKGYYEI